MSRPTDDKDDPRNGNNNGQGSAVEYQDTDADDEVTQEARENFQQEVATLQAETNNPSAPTPTISSTEFENINSAFKNIFDGKPDAPTLSYSPIGTTGRGTISYEFLQGGKPEKVNVTAKMRQSLDYFTKIGTRPDGQHWTVDQAKGIVASLMGESGFRANLPGDNGEAFGIAQWHSDRRAIYTSVTGEDMVKNPNFEKQLAFVNYELNHNEIKAGRALQEATDAGQAGAIVSMRYERPADVEGQARARARFAMSIPYNGAETPVAAETPATPPAAKNPDVASLKITPDATSKVAANNGTTPPAKPAHPPVLAS